MDEEMQKLLVDLEARFDAELSRQEEEAAGDLAAGLRQDRLLRSELARGSAARLLAEGLPRDVSVVGRDYVGSGWPLSCVTKIERAVVVLDGTGSPPLMREDTFIEVVRRWQRARLRVEVIMGGGSLTGMLDRVAADHLLIGRDQGSVMAALPVVTSIKLVRGG